MQGQPLNPRSDHVDDVIVLRKAAVGTVLVPQLLDLAVAVELDDVVAAASVEELDVDVVEVLLDVSGQTGRARAVASNHAVFDRHAHAEVIARAG
jgi:hypothetical protein